jgi:hypothetical protein
LFVGDIGQDSRWHRGVVSRDKGLDLPADYRQWQFSATADHLTVYEYEWKLGMVGKARAFRVEQVIVFDSHGISKSSVQLLCRPFRDFTPAILNAFRAGDRGTDNLYSNQLCHSDYSLSF